jgi:hypothetical protein
VQIDVDNGPAFEIRNCRNLELDGITTRKPRVDDPVIRMVNVRDAFIRGCRAFTGTGNFFELCGKTTSDIISIGNHFAAAKKSFILREGALEGAVTEK